MTKKLSESKTESKIRTEYFIGYSKPTDFERLERLVASFLESATVMDTRGVWKGELEDSAVVVDIGDGEINHDFINAVKRQLFQEAVLVTQTPVRSTIY